MINTLCILGTRPEAIKMAPLIKELNRNKQFDNRVCITSQHQEMLLSVMELFQLTSDYDLNVMTPNQTLTTLTTKILIGLENVLKKYTPDIILIHGDTTTAFAAAVSAYYHRIPIGHVEAGLRTGNIFSPWPEEANRKLAGSLSTIHFAPTQSAYNNLLKEGIPKSAIYITGNTVVDSLKDIVNQIEGDIFLSSKLHRKFSFLCVDRKVILVTGHRRENFGNGFENICKALLQVAKMFPDIDIVYPVHLNPNVQIPVKALLGNISNIYLIEPVDYLHFVYLMNVSYIILTDSGGIQEEAPTLGKPVLLMRETTERPEAVDVGGVKLVGNRVDSIVSNVSQLINDAHLYKQMSNVDNPYGDGNASKRILEIIASWAIDKHTYEVVCN